MTRKSHLRLLAAAGIVASLVLAACGSDSDSAGTTAAPTTAGNTETTTAGTGGAETTTASTTPVEQPKTIRIGYQQVPNGDLVVKQLGWLEEAFGPDVKIEWNLFDSGGSVNEAVVAGAVDVGLVGSSPTSRGISQGIEYRVPWIFDVIGKAESLVAKNGITSIADLKGKTVATPFASTAHFSLLAALADAGVPESDVKVIDAAPDDIFAAWERGDIDAAYVWNPNLAKLIASGGTVLITSADLAAKGKTTYDLAIVTNEFADKYPAAVQTWLEQQDRAITLIKDKPDEAAAAIATELNITADEAKSQLGDLVFLNASEQTGADYLGGGLATNLYDAAKFNKDQGKIETVKDEAEYQKAVDSSFAAAVK
jgi:taurine transport system substrate-binding protein